MEHLKKNMHEKVILHLFTVLFKLNNNSFSLNIKYVVLLMYKLVRKSNIFKNKTTHAKINNSSIFLN